MKEKLLKLKESGIYEHYWLCLVATICALFLSLYSIVCLMTGSRLYFYTTLLGVLFGISSYETEIIYASMGTAGVGANVLSYGGIALTVGLLLATISGCIITIGNKRGALNSICTWVFFLCCELCISMGGIYHGFMLTTAVIISYIMGFFALAFWLTHVIDKSAYKSAQKLLKRKSKSGIASMLLT